MNIKTNTKTDTKTDTLEMRLDALEASDKDTRRKLSTTAALALVACLALMGATAGKDATAQGYGITLAGLASRLTSVEAKSQFFSTNGNTTDGGNMYITRANLVIVSGSGTTNGAVNGFGNLIVGYNKSSSATEANRGGSHNIVIGDYHWYTSFGGLVAGRSNKITAPITTVLGGFDNTASGRGSSVGGGRPQHGERFLCHGLRW